MFVYLWKRTRLEMMKEKPKRKAKEVKQMWKCDTIRLFILKYFSKKTHDKQTNTKTFPFYAIERCRFIFVLKQMSSNVLNNDSNDKEYFYTYTNKFLYHSLSRVIIFINSLKQNLCTRVIWWAKPKILSFHMNLNLFSWNLKEYRLYHSYR